MKTFELVEAGDNAMLMNNAGSVRLFPGTRAVVQDEDARIFETWCWKAVGEQPASVADPEAPPPPPEESEDAGKVMPAGEGGIDG